LSFGGEWRFSLQQVGFRPDFPALYAAVLQTFCVNLWRKTDRPAAERMAKMQAADSAPPAAPTPAAHQAAHLAPSSPIRPIAAAIRSTPRERRIGAACALAGAAVLSWIVLSHQPPSFSERHASRTSVASVGSPERHIAPTQPAAQIAMAAGVPATAAASGQPNTHDIAYAEARAARHPRIGIAPAALAPIDKPSVRPKTVIHRPPLPATLPSTTYFVAEQPAEHAMGQSIAEASAADVSAAQQEASQPAALAAPAKSDAASTTLAATKPAAAPHSDAAQLPSYAKDTTWVNHLTHRRITDAPNQFGM
jgi:hypothetical protein